MKLLQLTDFHTKTKKEYIVIEKLARIEPYTQQFVKIINEDRTVTTEPSFLGKLRGQSSVTTTTKVETSREVVDRHGSRVVLSGNEQTMVLESPEEIAELLKNGSKTTKVKGVSNVARRSRTSSRN